MDGEIKPAHLIIEARKGNSHAQYLVALKYYTGQDLTENFQQALHWFSKSAEQNDSVACYYLGIMHYEGIGTPRDYGKAAKLLIKAYGPKDEWLKASCLLGEMYQTGKGVTQDYDRAIEFYSRAAHQRYPRAQYLLGRMYDQGMGVEVDYEQARTWYLRARNRDALLRIGDMYAKGIGAAQDEIEAYKFYILTLKVSWGENAKAAERLEALKQSLSVEQIELAEQRATALVENWRKPKD